jgi:oxygen-independent coproporphyrinogen-3 oxidase
LAGIYIHIPFCKQACTYCNFHFSTQLQNKEAFLIALKNEICCNNGFIGRNEIIETIYFGGGTPSLLSSIELEEILQVIFTQFKVSANAEITLEANPDDINSEVVANWIKIGINRLSVGIQSFVEEELIWMNRAHTAKHAIECIDIIQEIGIHNFSVDLIFGGPLLSHEALEKNIRIISSKNIPHISCYALTVEEKTALHHFITTKKSPPTNSEKQAEQFLMTMKLLAGEGYEQYEISNYAKPNMRSKHNSSYWQGKPYWGFGPAAHSFNGINKRRWNVANNSIYINNWLSHQPAFEEEILTETQKLNEYIMTALRTIEGISLNEIKNQFGEEKSALIIKQSKKIETEGKLFIKSAHLQLTTTGKLFADGISAELFF